jgi:hypothetical protein
MRIGLLTVNRDEIEAISHQRLEFSETETHRCLRPFCGIPILKDCVCRREKYNAKPCMSHGMAWRAVFKSRKATVRT